MPKRTLMISVKPEYAAMLLSGRKTVELRRIRPRVEPGDVVLLYATLPECRVVGYCHVTEVLLAVPAALWSDVGSATGVSRVDFDRYFEGAQIAVGIVMERPTRITERLSLEELRRLVPGFRPPQSFRYIGSTEKKLQQVLLGAVQRDIPAPTAR